MTKKTFCDNWKDINGQLAWYRYMAISSLVLSLLLSLSVTVQTYRPPIVVVKEKGKKYHMGKREEIDITEEDVRGFASEFIGRLHTWENFHPDKILEGISCIVTPGFRGRLKKTLGDKEYEGKDGQSLEQYAAFIKPRLAEGRTFVSFDRIVRVGGIPLATSMEAALGVVQDGRTPCNPIGLYVDSLSEYERRGKR